MIYKPEKLKAILSGKYRTLFGSDLARPPLEVGEIDPATKEEIQSCIELISSDKRMGTDCIPDVILHSSNPLLRKKLRKFVNSVFALREIPQPFNCARLHLLNKLKSGIPGLNDFRPIMITSPLVKLIESIALVELKNILEPAITAAQMGFISDLGTHLHILASVRQDY